MMQITPRKPILAGLMSSVLPGYGQLYNGEINKAIWLFLVFSFLSQPGIALVALYLPDAAMMPALVCGLLLTLALWICGIVDAVRSARRLPQYVAKPWQVSGAYMLVLILCNLIVLPFLIGYLRNYQVEPFRVPSTSMEPSVMAGDYFFADKRYNCPACKHRIARGDIALFVYPNDRTQIYIKRIIGLPGDQVRMHGNEVSVNGVALSERGTRIGDTIVNTEHDGARRWQVRWSTARAPADLTVAVPPGQVLVLGDNRDASADSRKFGTVPLQEVVGKARQVWFSYGKDGVRWSRLGKVLE
ncbi:signal peptidase I [Oxalobacteraceae bacterium GrIS 1.11]